MEEEKMVLVSEAELATGLMIKQLAAVDDLLIQATENAEKADFKDVPHYVPGLLTYTGSNGKYHIMQATMAAVLKTQRIKKVECAPFNDKETPDDKPYKIVNELNVTVAEGITLFTLLRRSDLTYFAGLAAKAWYPEPEGGAVNERPAG
jgi:hypothetical protein